MKMKMTTSSTTKPIVKYETSEFMFCGRKHTTRTKLTLLATFYGEQAKVLAEASKGSVYWQYHDTKGKEKLRVYKDEMLWSKPGPRAGGRPRKEKEEIKK